MGEWIFDCFCYFFSIKKQICLQEEKVNFVKWDFIELDLIDGWYPSIL